MRTSAGRLPPTVNMHVVGHCNYGCLYCYARFEKAKTLLPLDAATKILTGLKARGAQRITFAGGEPTLHRDIEAMLRCCADLGLVTALVTNGSQLDRNTCRRLFPWLRWLVLSCDSPNRETNDALGRKPRLDIQGQPIRVEQVVAWLHEWNESRPEHDRVRLKINIVVTAQNVHEDPSDWLQRLRPERVKLLQCAIIPGENDDAEHLRCPDADFVRYAARVRSGCESQPAMTVVPETSDDLLDSYAMVDPRGRFRQAVCDGYIESDPIQDVGVDRAWEQVGGCDLVRFRERGGDYDSGKPCRGVAHPIVAIEGLDGSGKSTVTQALAARLGALLMSSPPKSMAGERAEADAQGREGRRAWYWRANRRAMGEAIDAVFAGLSVVMDRCYVSTAVYGAAEKGEVASPGDVPRDEPRPDQVFFLALPEAERQKRLAGRMGTQTAEEGRLARDAAFRQRVLGGYEALGVCQVDARGSVESIVEAIIGKMGRG